DQRSDLPQPADQGRGQYLAAVGGCGDAKNASRGRRVEVGRLIAQLADLGKNALDRSGQCAALGGQLEVPADPLEQRVVKVLTQLAQRRAHAGLGDVDALRGAGDVSFREQRIERNQEVEVESLKT